MTRTPFLLPAGLPLLLLVLSAVPVARAAAAVPGWWAAVGPGAPELQRRSPIQDQAPFVASVPPEDLCPSDAAIRDLCQQCAKVTKDPKAFRMCCSNTREARAWCASFLDFGLN
ncbi:uncharacterized protein LOC144157588 [Haemaphysalis longicornis]